MAKNEDKLKKVCQQFVMDKLEKAVKQTDFDIIMENLPSGYTSPIAGTLFDKKHPDHMSVHFNDNVWSYLQYGTGVFSIKHRGRGKGGSIVPVEAKALHFKNAQLAAALGFPTEDVFLKSVKGIYPRWILENFYFSNRFTKTLASV